MLYHGSNHLILDAIEPRMSFGYKRLVYATEDYFYALVRAGNFNMERFLLYEDYVGKDKPFRLVEIIPGAFKEVFDVSGYIYEVDDDLFETYGDQTEFISNQSVKVIKTIKIDNVWNEMMKHAEHYELISYDNSEEHWKTVRGGKDGYLKRRTERLNKVREACSK